MGNLFKAYPVVALPSSNSNVYRLSGLTQVIKDAKTSETHYERSQFGATRAFVTYQNEKGEVILSVEPGWLSDGNTISGVELKSDGTRRNFQIRDDDKDGNYDFIFETTTHPNGKRTNKIYHSKSDNDVYNEFMLHDETQPGQHFDSNGCLIYKSYQNPLGF